MTKNFEHQDVGKSIGYGGIGGFVGGLAMSPFLIITAIVTGMPLETMPVAMGLLFGDFSKPDAMTIGFAMHMLTSVLIGVIFGTVTALVGRLKITRYRKGIIEGLIAGMVAFIVLFIPISMAVMPPILMKMSMQINPTITQEQFMSQMQQNMPPVIGLVILEHLVYGAVLGVVTSYLMLKTIIKRNYQEQRYTKEERKS
jgi:hypothetical protein